MNIFVVLLIVLFVIVLIIALLDYMDFLSYNIVCVFHYSIPVVKADIIPANTYL